MLHFFHSIHWMRIMKFSVWSLLPMYNPSYSCKCSWGLIASIAFSIGAQMSCTQSAATIAFLPVIVTLSYQRFCEYKDFLGDRRIFLLDTLLQVNLLKEKQNWSVLLLLLIFTMIRRKKWTQAVQWLLLIIDKDISDTMTSTSVK